MLHYWINLIPDFATLFKVKLFEKEKKFLDTSEKTRGYVFRANSWVKYRYPTYDGRASIFYLNLVLNKYNGKKSLIRFVNKN